MKILIYIIFLEYIKISFSTTPLWNFEASSYDLLKERNSYEYIVNTGTVWGQSNVGIFTIYKKIYKINGVIKQENILNLNFTNELRNYSTEYEDIESAYINDGNTYFVCPKGKFHVHYYSRYNGTNGIIYFNLKNDTNWDLKCFYQYQENTIFIGYLNSQNNFYQYLFQKEEYKYDGNINNGLYFFIWTTQTGNDGRKQMFAIVKEGNEFYLKDLRILVQEGNSFAYDHNGRHFLCYEKSNFLSMIKTDYTGFYYINYNDQFDFESGFSNQILNVDNFNNIEIKKNEETVFKFIDKISIKEMKFIYDTRFVYYKIYNEDKKQFYYGIIDVSLNKIIFNTDKKINEFKPLDSYSMLAITDDSAYKICAIQEDIWSDHFTCQEKCENDEELRLNVKYGNNCGRPCFWEGLPILKPDNICIEGCDSNYHIILKENEDQKECWLCKDLNTSFPYKLINRPTCLPDLPQNSQYVSKELFLVKCKEEYNYLENGNCVKECSDNFFLKNKDCQKCDESCKACEKSENNCIKCNEGEYLKKDPLTYNTCNKCSEKCETCSDEEKNGIDNCLSCKKNSTYEFLFNKNCVEKCPKDMISNKNNICIKKDEIDNKEEEKSKDKVMLVIFIVLTGFMLILVIFLFYKNVCCKSKNNNNLIDDIQSELIENKIIN